MCIYCNTANYRKIYESHYGPIPIDSSGRKYDVHHIDGNHDNNTPDNLKCVTVKEHYDIHYSQGDYGACYLISRRLRLSPQELADLAKKNNESRISSGQHNFLGGEIARVFSRKRVAEGTHHFLDSERARERNLTRIKNNNHHLVGGSHQQKQLENGTHPSQIKKTCEHCGRTFSSGMYGRYHGDKCKSRIDN